MSHVTRRTIAVFLHVGSMFDKMALNISQTCKSQHLNNKLFVVQPFASWITNKRYNPALFVMGKVRCVRPFLDCAVKNTEAVFLLFSHAAF